VLLSFSRILKLLADKIPQSAGDNEIPGDTGAEKPEALQPSTPLVCEMCHPALCMVPGGLARKATPCSYMENSQVSGASQQPGPDSTAADRHRSDVCHNGELHPW
jgi:hypothetical protein